MLEIAIASAINAGFREIDTAAGRRSLIGWLQCWPIPELRARGWRFDAARGAIVQADPHHPKAVPATFLLF